LFIYIFLAICKEYYGKYSSFFFLFYELRFVWLLIWLWCDCEFFYSIVNFSWLQFSSSLIIYELLSCHFLCTWKFFVIIVFFIYLNTSNARRCDSLDPRLNATESSAIIFFYILFWKASLNKYVHTKTGMAMSPSPFFKIHRRFKFSVEIV